MANFFYFDRNNQKQGPVSRDQLIELATQGDIEHASVVETNTGDRESAEYFIPSTCFKRAKAPLAIAEPSSGFFDIGFTRFISNTWISIIWCIVIIVHFLGAIGAMSYAFNTDGTTGVISLLAVPLITLVSLLSCRMALELEVIFFRIETNTRETKEYLREIKEQLGKK